ncbi:hypothetical protein B4064_3101 [Caldibacillus thermoamylovorans]|jgi:hypothetical protein|uniref:Uncharacterized protein n=1 Tax=Caldibacillus thermoamylovorans TaxID=35841 RepID=A0A0D0FCL6_9BACI|nr:hypothetical protein B4166_3493 [Caldibacillus thermoamylovorans]KIO63883.1 hypothetical protein B4064_3101 [Caldibacillus thermoamylovorans]KIO67243.1 hypothetical protein B4065_2019 [Caldibacillus thermoamylovorans]KIO71471.1 hypothetical protein B4167_3728 [Caldibacillus thermoamylovorans]
MRSRTMKKSMELKQPKTTMKKKKNCGCGRRRKRETDQ